MKPSARLRSLLLASSALLTISYSQATTFYWDQNGATGGFGTGTGTWAEDDTSPGPSRWTTSIDGTLAGSLTQATDIADSFNFGTSTLALAAGTITVSGTVDMGNLTYGSASGAIVLSGGTINLAAAQTTTVNNATNTISSALTGAGTSFTKDGTGILVLSGASSYTGTTIINRGTLTLNRQTGSLATTSPLTFSGTGIFNMDNVGASGALTQTLGALSFTAGQGTVQITRTAAFDQAITFASLTARTAGATGNFVNVGGTNSATNGFLFTSAPTAGTLIDRGIFYNGSSYATYDAGGFVRGFTAGDTNYLAAPTAATIGSSTATSNVDLTTGNITDQTAVSANTINMRNFNIVMAGTNTVLQSNGLLSSDSSSATLGGGISSRLQPSTAGGEIVVRVNGASDVLGVSSIIQNNTSASSLTKTGAGTLVLSGSASNTYGGLTSVSGGTLNLGKSGTANAIAAGGLSVGSGTTVTYTGASTDMIANAAPVTVTGSGLLNLNGVSDTIGTLGLTAIAGNNALITTGAGTLTLGGNVTFTAATTGTAQISGLLDLGAATRTFSIGAGTGAGQDLLVNAAISGTGVGLTKTGTGRLTLSGTNSYSGTTIVSGGTLIGTNATQSFGTNLSGINIQGAGTLSLRNDSSVSFTNGTSAYNIANSASGATINVDRVTGTGTNTITVGNLTTTSSSVTWQLNFTGNNGVSLNAGALTTPTAAAGSHTISNNIAGGGALTLSSVAGGGTGAAATLIFNGTGNTTVSGAITQAATAQALTKNGAGKLTLNGTNSYTGATAVNAGTLEVALGGSTHASSAVSVSNSGSALVVNGTVNGTLVANASTTISGSGTVMGAATVSGNLTPGNSAGLLTFNSSLAMANTTATGMEIAGTTLGVNYDAIDANGALTYDGALTLALGATFGAGSYTFNLFDFASQSGSFDTVALTGNYTGTFTNSLGVWLTTTNVGNETWTFTQSTGDLSLVVIPEPNTAILSGLGVLMLLRRRR